MSYSVKEVFPTLQGEGGQAGRFAVFVRFAGCNLWNGKQADRARDAGRNSVECPMWCDTDFVGGMSLSVSGLVSHMEASAREYGREPEDALVVFTGGEPLLQLDRALILALRDRHPGWTLALETNGTVKPKAGVELDWVCVSPKVPADLLEVREGQELKVVYPAYNPADYASVAANFERCYVSPEADTLDVGRSLVRATSVRAAATYCLRNPSWRLSLQAHKIIGLQ